MSQRIVPARVLAQAQTPIPREIRAESFVIVDENGKPRGAFGIGSNSELPSIEITDTKGYPYIVRFWGPPTKGFWPVQDKNAKPSLVPAQ